MKLDVRDDGGRECAIRLSRRVRLDVDSAS